MLYIYKMWKVYDNANNNNNDNDNDNDGKRIKFYHTTIKYICIFLSNAYTCISIFCGTPFLSYVVISLLFTRMVFCNYSYDVINFWYASSISFCTTILQFQADFNNICIIDFAFYLRMKREYLFVCLIGVFGPI